MGFLDEAVITAVSGDGGKGCVSFRRERFIPRGGPDGGKGGEGGAIIIRASRRRHTLSDFSSRRHFIAQNGRPGRGKNQTGKGGSDVIIEVPLGTIIYDHDTGEMLADLVQHKQEILVLPGGKGGKGNSYFVTSTNRAPRFAQPGLPGQKKVLRLSLRYLADIGLIGLPNTGKSTLLSHLTMARPRIDRYPFTTISPNLGIIEFEDQSSLTLADIPGLVEGASEGRGLGHRFLKHIERTRFLLHLIDITHAPANNILKEYQVIQHELEKFNPSLARKEQMVLINKIDLCPPKQNDIESLKKAFEDIGMESLPISALTGKGLEDLKQILSKKFNETI